MPDRGDAEAPGALAHVFTPVRIGGLGLPHRIAMGSMHLGVEGAADAGRRLAAFYRERARGGAGLIVTGGWAVSADGAADGSYGVLGGEEARRALAAVAGATAGTEAALALQLFHAGRYASADSPGEVVAPAALPSRVSRAAPRALGGEEVREVVAQFAAGARLAVELGFAAVEVMGSEGYLVDQFLSPVTNRREDCWGGDAAGRMRFGVEVAAAVREAVGAEFPVIFRMTGAELMPDSRPWAEVEAFAAALVGAGVDALNIGVGWHESPVPTVQGPVPSGAFVPWAARLKASLAGTTTDGGGSAGDGTSSSGEGAGLGGGAASSGAPAPAAAMATVPVIAGNRINRLRDAEEILAAGGVDMVSMSRPFLADPRIVAKGRRGGAVNVCISCDQACIDRSLVGAHVSCLVNPRAGHELDFPSPPPAGSRRSAGGAAKRGPGGAAGRFVVVGGGPAGMEAARALAARGAAVRLYEARAELGGQFRWARLVPGKGDYGATIAYFESELRRLGVQVRLGHELGEADADALAACAGVVLATGVHPRAVDIPGASLPHVVDYADAFEAGLGAARSVAIVGAGGIGVDLAHLLAHGAGGADAGEDGRAAGDARGFYARYRVAPPSTAGEPRLAGISDHGSEALPEPGPKVTLMRRSGRVGAGIGRTTRWVWLDALKRAGVETRTGLRYHRITPHGVEIELEEGGTELIAADRVVIAAGQERRDELRPLLERLAVPHQVIGGAADPRELNAVRAFAEGLRAAHALAAGC